jgi:hypothetical protein
MSKIKDLLNEQQVRRFMKLAEISSLDETEELEEGGLADKDDPRNRRNTERSRPMEEGEHADEETVDEAAHKDEETVEEGGLAGHYTGPKSVEEGAHDAADKAKTGAPSPTIKKVASGAKDIAKTAAKGAALGGALGGVPGAALGAMTGGLGKAVKVALQKEGIDGLNESQVTELVQRIQRRIVQENRQVQRLAEREKRVQALEAQMISEIEAKRAQENKEALIENLVSRTVARLKALKDK